jgi:hypothetical protein
MQNKQFQLSVVSYVESKVKLQKKFMVLRPILTKYSNFDHGLAKNLLLILERFDIDNEG